MTAAARRPQVAARAIRRAALALCAMLATLAALLATAAVAAAAPPPPPAISAPSAIVIQPASGDVLYTRAADERRPIASTTKLMTALLTMERAHLSDVFAAAPYRALAVESQIGLRTGERMTVADLMRGLMLESANDAAETLAVRIAGSRRAFVRLMNRRTRELGLRDTHYGNPIGLDAPRNYSSARDLAALAVEVRRVPFVRRVADRTRAGLRSGDRPRIVRNRNTLVADGPAWVNGLKTGHTLGAGYVLVGTGTRRGVTIVSVVLGTASETARNRDTLRLLSWGMRQYRRRRLVAPGQPAGAVAIRYRRGAELALETGRGVRRTVRRDAKVTTRDVGVPAEVSGPIDRGERLGWREVRVNGELIARVPIESTAYVPAAGLAQRTKEWFTHPLALLVVVALAGCSVLVARRLRRRPVHRRATRSEPEAA